MNNAVSQIVTVLTAIVGVAILAVLVSKNAQTPAVVKSFGQAFSGALSAATAPVTGGFASTSF
jgi:hypothetical protein